jgi:hypothetical protein
MMARAAAPIVVALLLGVGIHAFAAESEVDPRQALAARISEVAALDRLVLANGRSQALADPKVDQRLDDLLYKLRGPALWDAKHPAWAPARAALREKVARESNEWIAAFWRESASKTHVGELASGYRREYLAELLAFAESPGGAAWFARRVADARANAGEAMFSRDAATSAQLQKAALDARRRFDALPAAEKQRVKSFTDDPACGGCGAKSNAQFLDIVLDGQSRWMGEVMLLHLTDIDYRKLGAWRAELDTQFLARLPVDSKKQLLGTLEMRPDAALIFRFTFYWNDAANGGRLALELPRSHPNYAETLALAPGIAPGQSRVLYRDENGVTSDKP